MKLWFRRLNDSLTNVKWSIIRGKKSEYLNSEPGITKNKNLRIVEESQ
jgi:hypothetical protein